MFVIDGVMLLVLFCDVRDVIFDLGVVDWI